MTLNENIRLRDNYCSREELIDSIEFYSEAINKKIIKIEEIKKDIDNNVQRFPKDNAQIIYDTKKRIYQDIRTVLNARYSLGLDCSTLGDLYVLGIEYIGDISKDLAYFNVLRYVSLGILLGIDKSQMQPLITKLDDEKFDDILFDYLVDSYGIKRTYRSTIVAYPNPYKLMIDIIEVAKSDKEKASKLLKEYTEKKWIDGHSDCGWKTFHKKPDYVGLWSYEAGLVSKILGLDDSGLENSIHYPYDLVHYANIEFSKQMITNDTEDKCRNDYKYGIARNAELENIIPVKYHEKIQHVIEDYENLTAKEMWTRYELYDIWYDLEEYIECSEDGILGEIIVNILVEEGYILQLDYKEEVNDYLDNIRTEWGSVDYKLVQFDIDNDQYYLAKIPAKNQLVNIYEVNVIEYNG